MSLFLSIFLTVSINFNYDEVRDLFPIASENKEANEKLMKLTDGYTIDYRPVVYAYHAASLTTMANHVLWPGTKFSYFNDGKNKLEKVVKKYPKNVEIRFIRFAVQRGSPDFLYYKGNLQEDKSFIKKNLSSADLPESYKTLIEETIK